MVMPPCGYDLLWYGCGPGCFRMAPLDDLEFMDDDGPRRSESTLDGSPTDDSVLDDVEFEEVGSYNGSVRRGPIREDNLDNLQLDEIDESDEVDDSDWERLRARSRRTAGSLLSYHEEFYPHGLRKTLALLIIFGATVLPTMIAWEQSPIEEPGSASMPTGRFVPRGGFLPDRPQPSSGIGRWIAGVFTTLAVTFGVVLYYPKSGFKRYAILCGPVMALCIPACLGAYLSGRVEVFRIEIMLVTLEVVSKRL